MKYCKFYFCFTALPFAGHFAATARLAQLSLSLLGRFYGLFSGHNYGLFVESYVQLGHDL